mmetsp:Transcript_10020/g.14751  ORF Transcript_10020/g.14751 Transcript_10020/m.14751 type:complete len:261 (+) Transcript_10020:47-829(+)
MIYNELKSEKKEERTSNSLKVICIEGVHGAGKSSIVNWFKINGFHVIDEGFMTEEVYLHPQTFVMEMTWITTWFQRLLKIKHEADEESKRTNKYKEIVLIADRSPFSAIFYARGGKGNLFDSCIRESMKDLETEQIEILTVKIHVEKKKLMSRIAKRLKKHPDRKNYNEHLYEWNSSIYDKYEQYKGFDLVLDNTQDLKKFDDLIEQLLTSVNCRVQKIKEIEVDSLSETTSSSESEEEEDDEQEKVADKHTTKVAIKVR